MEMLSGSQINSFLSATSLVWSSSIVLLMVGLVYFLKYKERHSSNKNSHFLVLYIFTLILNIMEYVLTIVMQNNPSYEMIIYKSYILLGFFWNIAVIFYVINYINQNNQSKVISRIFYIALIVIATVVCVLLDIEPTLEINGKFYVLTGTLYNVYTISAIIANLIFLIIVLIYRKRMPKGFSLLCFITFLLYLAIIIFRLLTEYQVKEPVFIYSLIVLIIFNTTSNQDKEAVSKLNMEKEVLVKTNNERSLFINKISSRLGSSLNDLILYTDDLNLTKDKTKETIQSGSLEIKNATNDFIEYVVNAKDLFVIESNKSKYDVQYQLNTLINDVYSRVYPLMINKKVKVNMFVGDNSYLNYIGDIYKLEKIIINVLNDAINNSKEGDSVYITFTGKQYDFKTIELVINIKNSSNKEIDLNNLDNLKLITSNKLLELFNSKIDITKEENSTVYSFAVLQGLVNNELYNSIK